MNGNYENRISIVMPCLNEQQTLGKCIEKAKAAMEKMGGYSYEIIIADNGSTDRSVEIAKSLGARVITVLERGYGSALRSGIEAADGNYIIMGDADDSYDFLNIEPFIIKLDEGYDLVMGDRFLGGIEPGAMSFSHQYIGNPILSGIGRLFFKTKIRDFHCGMRGFRKESIINLGLCTTGMEFASEMVVKAVLNNMRIAEIPVKLFPDGRDRKPHLRSIPDGWRHLKFLLIYSPKWLFFYPGLLMSIIGFVGTVILSVFTIKIGQIQFEMNTMYYFTLLLLTGIQAVQFSVFTDIYGRRIGQFPISSNLTKDIEKIMTKYSLPIAALFTFLGVIGIISTVLFWSGAGFGEIHDTRVHRFAILFGTLFIMGIQFFFSGFFVNVLHMGESNEWE